MQSTYYQLPVSSVIQQARRGVLRRRVDEIAQLVHLTDVEMARILNMSVRSLHGKAANESLNLAASERLLLLEQLIQHGLQVFDRRADLLSRWLRTPLAELGYREGTEEVSIRPLAEMGSFYKSEFPNQTSENEQTIETKFVAQSPIAVLDTVSGFSLVDDVLGRIEWGIVG
jgi:uncharacterized protein (DUF2384 family)